ncbi:restriction endonuclease subunit S [Alphaproteobacteria bacterium]|nr:restriction endonuclease subunit S [Alphaproteobacteria bacterium]
MIQFSNFQTSYPLVPLEELLESYIGGDWGIAPDKNDAEYVNVKCIRATELKNWTTEKAQTAAPRKIKKASLVKRNLLEGDIVLEISGGGPEQPVGRVEVITKEVISSNHGKNLVCTNFFRMLRPNNQVIPKFLKLYLDFFYLCGPIQELQSGSNNLRNLKFNDYLKIEVPLPDIERQHSIIQSIEIANGQIDTGVEALCLAEKQLELYRQSVLKDAFEGKLTADWRKANPDLVEPADKLLARIEAERKAAHQAESDAWKDAVNQWEVRGKDGKKPSKPKAPHALPTIVDELSLFEGKIPEDWFLGTVGHLTNGVEYGTSSKSKKTGSYPVFRMGNLQSGELTWDDLVFTNDEAEFKKYELNSGDVLFNRTNSPELVGKSAIFKGEQPSLFAGYLIRVNQIDTVCLPEFLNYFLNSSKAKQYGNLVKTDGVNQSNINGKKLLSYPIPICSIAEQKEIVLRIQKQCNAIKQNQIMLQKMSQQSSALKQSILKQAFSGHELLEDAS